MYALLEDFAISVHLNLLHVNQVHLILLQKELLKQTVLHVLLVNIALEHLFHPPSLVQPDIIVRLDLQFQLQLPQQKDTIQEQQHQTKLHEQLERIIHLQAKVLE